MTRLWYRFWQSHCALILLWCSSVVTLLDFSVQSLHFLTHVLPSHLLDTSSYGDCLEVKREYYPNCSVLDCVTQCSQSAAHLYEQFLQVQQIEFVTFWPVRCASRWLPRVILSLTWWSGYDGIQAWSRRPAVFLQYFDTVCLVIWPAVIAHGWISMLLV